MNLNGNIILRINSNCIISILKAYVNLLTSFCERQQISLVFNSVAAFFSSSVENRRSIMQKTRLKIISIVFVFFSS